MTLHDFLDFDLLEILYAVPSVIVGGVAGALIWRSHRVAGAILGAVVCHTLWWFAVLWTTSNQPWQGQDVPYVLLHLLAITLPGIIVGGLVGALIWRPSRPAGAIIGAVVLNLLWFHAATTISVETKKCEPGTPVDVRC
jgi:hypothetical protein